MKHFSVFAGACLLVSSVSANAMVTYLQGQTMWPANKPVQFIVKLAPMASQDIAQTVHTIAKETTLPLTYVRNMSTGDQVLALDQSQMDVLYSNQDVSYEVHKLANKIKAVQGVVDACPDYILTMQMTPNVSDFDKQWDLYEKTAGIDAPLAWDVTKGSSDVVVGVIDTGIVDHENFKGDDANKILPGYSFVRHSSDVTDDGVRAGDRVVFHGTHVAGTIAASAAEGNHIAGIAMKSRILPVQVLGSDGAGNMSNIIDGMRWAAGLDVNNAPKNENPAQVLNMSLGGQTLLGLGCFLVFPLQQAITEITAAGTTIIAAGGNGDQNGDPQDVKGFVPAGCNGVVTVASVGRDGKRAFYSNYGDKVDLAAPGGDQGRGHEHDENGIYSTTNIGKYEYYQGTSMAAPHVAGVAALMLAVNKNLSPSDVQKGLTESTTPFVADSGTLPCSNPGTCGAGNLNANNAVQWAAKHLQAAS